MAIRRPPTTFSDTISTADIADDAITGGKLANDIAISTTGNIATTGSGTLTSAGAFTASGGIANSGTITAGTLGSSVVFPAGHVIQVQQQFKTITNTSGGGDHAQVTVTATAFSSGYKLHEFSFTPKYSNSKLLLQYDGQVQVSGGTVGAEIYFARDNTNTGTNNGTKTRTDGKGNKVANQFLYTDAANSNLYFPTNVCHMVDAGQNTAIRFLVIATSYDGDHVIFQHDGTSVFTIMEIAQ